MPGQTQTKALAATPPDEFSTQATCYILGMLPSKKSWVNISKSLVAKGLLGTKRDPADGKKLVVPGESLRQVLRSHLLPNGQDADAWINYRMATFNTPQATRLWKTPRVVQVLCLDWSGVVRLLEEGKLEYIWSPGKVQRWVTPESVQRYTEGELVVTPETIAHCFDVTVDVAKTWQAEGAFTCDLPHRHQPGILYEPCFKRVMKQLYLPGSITFDQWLYWRNKGIGPLVHARRVCTILGLPAEAVEELATSGTAKAIRSPQGVWYFIEHGVRKIRKAQRRA